MLSFAVLGIMFIGMTRPDNSTFGVIPLVSLPASLPCALADGRDAAGYDRPAEFHL